MRKEFPIFILQFEQPASVEGGWAQMATISWVEFLRMENS